MGTTFRSFVMRVMLLFALYVILMPACAFAEIPAEIEEAIPQEAQQFWNAVDPDALSLEDGIGTLLDQLREILPMLLREGVGRMVSLFAVGLLCSLLSSVNVSENSQLNSCVTAAGVLAVTLLTTRQMESMMGVGTQIIEELDVFSKALLPTLAAAIAAGGGIVSAGVRQTATIVFSNILLGIVHDFLLPFSYFYIAAAAMAALLPEQNLMGLADGIKKVITWLLTGSLLLFTGYLTIAGAAATSADALTLQLTKSAISTAVPIVGGIISDAADSVLHSAVLLKNTVGVFGMLAVLASCLRPFLTMALQYLLYKAVGFSAGVLGKTPVVSYIKELGNAFGLLLGMIGSCAMLLLISIASCVSVVIT